MKYDNIYVYNKYLQIKVASTIVVTEFYNFMRWVFILEDTKKIRQKKLR